MLMVQRHGWRAYVLQSISAYLRGDPGICLRFGVTEVITVMKSAPLCGRRRPKALRGAIFSRAVSRGFGNPASWVF